MVAIIECEGEGTLHADLPIVSRWVFGALHNQLLLPWVPVGLLRKPKPPSEDLEYRVLYASMVEWLPAIEPDEKALLTAYEPSPPWPYAPGLPDSPSRRRFTVLHGYPGQEFADRSRQFFECMAGTVEEARRLLRQPIELTGSLNEPESSIPAAETALQAGELNSKLDSTSFAPIAPDPVPLPTETRARATTEPETPIRQLDRASVQIAARPLTFTPVAQVQGVLVAPGKPPATIMAVATERLIAWLQGKDVAVPVDWRSRASWEAGTDGAARQVWCESADAHFAVRFDEPCGELPGRQWRVEFTMVENDGRVLVGTKVSALVHKGVPTSVRPSVPKWVRSLATDLTFVADDQVLTDRPTDVGNETQLQRLVGLISGRRSCAVVVCVTPRARSKEGALAAQLASRVAGAAHVITLHARLLPALARALGDAGRIPPSGVRFFGRAFDKSLAAVRCPILPPGLWPSYAGVDLLAEACAAETVSLQDPDDLPSFAQIRQFVVRRRRQFERQRNEGASRKIEDRLKASIAERDALEGDLGAAEQLVEELQRTIDAQVDDLRAKETKLWFLEQRVQELEARQAAGEATSEDPAPISWDELYAWTERRYSDRLVITDKARRAARDSVFADVGFVSEVISLLAGPYWDMRTGDETARDAYLEEAKRLRVDVSGVGDALNTARLAGQYRTTWKGRTYTLDTHVSGSSSRDRQRGFRLYFAWDVERRLIVVGSFPEHLTNAHS